MNQPLISVVVPAYNVEKTLGKALESIIGQSLREIEVIVVDDGSSDSTRAIAGRYRARDGRVTVIEKNENEGLSAARNSAIAAAAGEYITFVDGDDWIEPEYYKELYNAAAGADIVVGGMFHDSLDDGGELKVCTTDRTNTSAVCENRRDIAAWAARLDGMRLFAFTCNKLYRREFLEKCGCIFQKRTLIEDYIYNCEIWGEIEKLTITDVCGYHYVKFSKEALTQRFLPDYFEIIKSRYALMRDMQEAAGTFSGETREIVCNMHIKHLIAGMVRNFSDKAGYTAAQKKAGIQEMLSDPDSLEAMDSAKGKRLQERVCNGVFKTKSVGLNYIFAKCIYKMQNSKNKLFDRVK